MTTKRRVLVVDDEAGVRFGIGEFLRSRGYEVEEAETCRGAEEAFRALSADVAVLDYVLPDGNALDLLRTLRGIDPAVPVVILTGHGSIDLAVKAIKEGAEQFLTKPVELPALCVIIERVLENQRNRQKQLAGASRGARGGIEPFLGTSAAVRQLAEQARRVLPAESPILIQGETGVGKGVLAGWLHHNGPRAEEAFVDLNCAALSKEFLETELFGHEKGAFTGAVTNKPGLLEIAHRGTVFLDEIGDMDPQIQPRLLKVLEEKRFRRLGDVRDRRVDIRLVVATHQDLGSLVRANRFRSDLYFRISAIPLHVPSLRDRIEDIPLLAQRLLKEFGAELGRGDLDLAPGAVAALQAYSWPGNIRELRNVLERAVLLSEARTLGAADLRFEEPGDSGPLSAESDLTLEDLERWHIARVLEQEKGHVDRAARRLGVPRSTLYQKIKRYGMTVSRV